MNINYEKSFLKDLEKIDIEIAKKLTLIIGKVKESNSINDISNIKKLSGYQSYYRIRIGDYRLGIKLLDKNNVTFIRIKHRKDIYKNFP